MPQLPDDQRLDAHSWSKLIKENQHMIDVVQPVRLLPSGPYQAVGASIRNRSAEADIALTFARASDQGHTEYISLRDGERLRDWLNIVLPINREEPTTDV